MLTSQLEVRNVSKSFGPTVALRDVSLTAKAGEVHAVIGENGAGKSTLMNIICGNLKVSFGEVLIDGRPAQFASPMEAQKAGISIAPQEILLAPDLTVAENVMLGRQHASAGVVNWRTTRADAARHLAALDPDIDPNARAGRVTVAQQQLIQIARATATGARLLIFDEPTAALTHKESARLFDFIKRFGAGGGAVLYISHRLDEILELSDRISVLRDGSYVSELDPKGRVHGLKALRVVCAAIMPRVISGNLSATTYMMAEKISDDIRGRRTRFSQPNDEGEALRS